MDAGAKYKINTIPGVELYLKHREHFILFAKNYKGYQAISKTMRNADYQPAKKSKKNKDSEEGSQRYYACADDVFFLFVFSSFLRFSFFTRRFFIISSDSL